MPISFVGWLYVAFPQFFAGLMLGIAIDPVSRPQRFQTC